MAQKKIIDGNTYTLYAVSNDKKRAERDKRVLKNRGYESVRIIKEKKGYGKLPRYEIWAIK